jgi:hypothetical protein
LNDDEFVPGFKFETSPKKDLSGGKNERLSVDRAKKYLNRDW